MSKDDTCFWQSDAQRRRSLPCRYHRRTLMLNMSVELQRNGQLSFGPCATQVFEPVRTRTLAFGWLSWPAGRDAHRRVICQTKNYKISRSELKRYDQSLRCPGTMRARLPPTIWVSSQMPCDKECAGRPVSCGVQSKRHYEFQLLRRCRTWPTHQRRIMTVG